MPGCSFSGQVVQEQVDQKESKITKAMEVAAAEELLKSRQNIEFPLTLYILNYDDVKNKGSEAKVVLGPSDTKKINDNAICNSAITTTKNVGGKGQKQNILYYHEIYSQKDFRRLMGAEEISAGYRDKSKVQNMVPEQNQFRAPDEIKLSMSQKQWENIGLHAGWLKHAQATNDPAKQQQQQEMSAYQKKMEELQAQAEQKDKNIQTQSQQTSNAVANAQKEMNAARSSAPQGCDVTTAVAGSTLGFGGDDAACAAAKQRYQAAQKNLNDANATQAELQAQKAEAQNQKNQMEQLANPQLYAGSLS